MIGAIRAAATHPLSAAQMGAWSRAQSGESGAAYIHSALCQLRGPLRVKALEDSLSEIVRRHEVLRTTYHAEDGLPIPVIQAARPLSLATVDLRHLPESERETTARQLAAEEARRSFDIARDLMLRAVLFRLGDEEHFLLLAAHEIAWDGWSTAIAIRELAAFYDSGAVPAGPVPSDLPAQYRDFADRERAWLQSDALEAQLSYWSERLAGSTDMLALPASRPRPTRPTYRGARERLLVPRELSGRLKILGQQEHVSLMVVLLGAFQTLLHRYTGKADIVVGTPVDSRAGFMQLLVGPFANPVALRTNFSASARFRELMVHLRDIVTEAHAHSEVPFEKLVGTIHPSPSLSYPTLFQTTFQLRNTPASITVRSGLELQEVDFYSGGARYDLTLEVTEKPQGLSCVLTYNTDLFEAEFMQNMLCHYQTVLVAVAGNPEWPIAQLPILTAAERQRILLTWNDTAEPLPECCVQQLYEDQVERTPGAVAVSDEKERLTYRELNIRANQLARALLTLGVGPGMVVGICLERSVEMVVGLMAILKAGGAYLPLDPAHPLQRLAFMLSDSRAQVVLCHQWLKDKLTPSTAKALPIEEWPGALAGRSQQNPIPRVTPDDLAYVLYTSGSTGKPKGVLIPQRALVNLLCSMRRWFHFEPNDVLLAVTTISFDIAAIDIWLPLSIGARTVVVSRETASDGDALGNALSREGASFMQATPSTWRILLEAGWRGKQDLRAVSTGEQMPRELAERLLPRTKRLWNMYGPTETTVWSTGSEIQAPGRVLIGRPIGNTTIYILDSRLQPVPVGVTGELYIGGAGLARGYMNLPELTREKFIPDPFAGAPGAKLYNTGDLARYLPDGNIECLGRTDHQVKIRGFRIELGEIEAALSEHAGVRQAAVAVWKGPLDHQSILAYIVPDQKLPPSEEQLRGFLKQMLPDYMIPARYEFLRALPLTSSGKLDRRALPSPAAIQPGRSAASHDSLESQLMTMWEEVLQISPIGHHSDFFDLGGNSLLAASLLARIGRTLHKRVPLSVLFEAPTIARLAALLSYRKWTPRSCVVAVQSSGSRPPFFCLGAGPLFRNLAKRLGPDQPFLTLLLEDELLSAAHRLEDIAAFHVGLIRETQPEGPYFVGGWSDAGVLAYEVAQQLQEQGQRVALLVLFDAENVAYPKHLSRVESVYARMDAFGQWVRINLDLLRNSGRSEMFRRVRQGLAFRSSWIRQRLRVRAALQMDAHPSSNEDALALAVARYEPQPYRGRLVLFQRSARPKGRYHYPQSGWGELVDPIEIQEIPGDHRDMFLEPNVQILAAGLGRCLVEAQTPGAAGPIGTEHEVTSAPNA